MDNTQILGGVQSALQAQLQGPLTTILLIPKPFLGRNLEFLLSVHLTDSLNKVPYQRFHLEPK